MKERKEKLLHLSQNILRGMSVREDGIGVIHFGIILYLHFNGCLSSGSKKTPLSWNFWMETLLRGADWFTQRYKKCLDYNFSHRKMSLQIQTEMTNQKVNSSPSKMVMNICTCLDIKCSDLLGKWNGLEQSTSHLSQSATQWFHSQDIQVIFVYRNTNKGYF